MLRFLGNDNGVLLLRHGEDVNGDLGAERVQLVDSRRTVDVRGGQKDFAALFALEVRAQFGGESRFTRTLKARH